MKLLGKMAGGLYAILNKKHPLVGGGVRTDLERLHPGEDSEELCRKYGIAKLERSITIMLVGSLLAAFMALKASDERVLEGNELYREDVLGEARSVEVETVLEGQKERFEILVEPVLMDEEETERCVSAFCEDLPRLITGENESIQAVTGALELMDCYEGYPFLVEWRSDVPEVVSSSGEVYPGEIAREAHLRALFSYGEQEWEEVLTVQVLGEVLTPEQQRYRELEEQLLTAHKDSRTEAVWTLPSQWEGTTLQWHRVVEDNSLLVWVGALLVGVVIYLLSDKDLHQEIEKRREHMKREYPDIVHKLALYLGAGMTLQGSFQKIASEEAKCEGGGRIEGSAYREMQYTCRELKSGVSESDAYERFGKRTGLQEYIRLSTLMSQNLKKGSSSLLPRLQEEADRAMAERIQSGKKLGEEASTKLLIPMVMMLAVVMVMVMLPAFSSMGL